MPECQNCKKEFPNQIEVDGKIWNLISRKFCLECSPLGQNNRRTYVVPIETGKAFCARCRKQKDRSEFHNRKCGSPLSYCRQCSEEVKNLKFIEKIEKAVALKGGACFDCGNVFPAIVFEFIKDDKTLPLGTVKNMSWERFKEILEDYKMLCKNCIAMRKWANDVT